MQPERETCLLYADSANCKSNAINTRPKNVDGVPSLNGMKLYTITISLLMEMPV
jgi:hypothetical protein